MKFSNKKTTASVKKIWIKKKEKKSYVRLPSKTAATTKGLNFYLTIEPTSTPIVLYCKNYRHTLKALLSHSQPFAS